MDTGGRVTRTVMPTEPRNQLAPKKAIVCGSAYVGDGRTRSVRPRRRLDPGVLLNEPDQSRPAILQRGKQRRGVPIPRSSVGKSGAHAVHDL